MIREQVCSCGESFGVGGDVITVNNVPAATWALLEHQSITGHPPKENI